MRSEIEVAQQKSATASAGKQNVIEYNPTYYMVAHFRLLHMLTDFSAPQPAPGPGLWALGAPGSRLCDKYCLLGTSPAHLQRLQHTTYPFDLHGYRKFWSLAQQRAKYGHGWRSGPQRVQWGLSLLHVQRPAAGAHG